MIVGIGDIATEAAMRRRIGQAQQPSAMCGESIEQRLDVALRQDIVSKRESAGPSKAPLHVGLERRAEPGAQHFIW